MASETSYGYIQGKAKDGSIYAIGYPADKIPAPDNEDAPLGDKHSFNLDVDWPVDGKSHQTDQAFADKTGITSYVVGASSSPLYDYYVEITCNETYDYYFTDAEGTAYNMNVWSAGSHIVRYNSEDGRIVHVSGS